MKDSLLIVFSVIICIFITSCNETTNPDNNVIRTTGRYTKIKENQTKDVPLPLKIGNYWEYRVLFDTNEINYNIWGRDIFEVTGDTLINGDKFFIISTTLYNFRKFLMSNTDIGIWFYDINTKNSDYLEVKYPAVNNDIYYSNVKIWFYQLPDTANLKFYEAERQLKVETNQNVTVEAGTFNCYKFTESYSNFKFYDLNIDTLRFTQSVYYYALNVGKVKEEFYQITLLNGIEIKKEKFMIYNLKEYKLN